MARLRHVHGGLDRRHDRRAKVVTQFGRALGELNIDIICANSPQAKGRVERMHQTFQDRLVKELRLRGISTMDDGNAFLPEFMDDYDRRFGRPPRNPHDAHRPLRPDEDLDRIFTWQVERTLSRILVVHHDRVTYLVQPLSPPHRKHPRSGEAPRSCSSRMRTASAGSRRASWRHADTSCCRRRTEKRRARSREGTAAGSISC
jgi:hypothetical protein